MHLSDTGGGTISDPDNPENGSEVDCDAVSVDQAGECQPDPEPCKTSVEEIEKAFPNASTTAKEKLEEVINKHGAKFGINTAPELQHFLAQAGHESGGFTDLSVAENMNYSVQGLLNRFGNSFSQTDSSKADPDDYVGNPEKIANLVYSKSKKPTLGNGDVASGDGWRYRGRGIFQLSGKYNYQQFTNFAQNTLGISANYVQKPDQIANDPEAAILSAMWFFKRFVSSEITIDKNTTVEEVTDEINSGGANLDDRKTKFKDAKTHIDNCQE